MLDKNQTIVAQATLVNASHLATAIASNVFGNSVSDQINGQTLTAEVIGNVVANKIRSTFLKQGAQDAQ